VTERFFQIDPARSRQLGGTGLGLAIVNHIVRRHRGHLAIDNDLGRGTAVTVYLSADWSAVPKSPVAVTWLSHNCQITLIEQRHRPKVVPHPGGYRCNVP
jgi:hypothetical protein